MVNSFFVTINLSNVYEFDKKIVICYDFMSLNIFLSIIELSKYSQTF